MRWTYIRLVIKLSLSSSHLWSVLYVPTACGYSRNPTNSYPVECFNEYYGELWEVYPSCTRGHTNGLRNENHLNITVLIHTLRGSHHRHFTTTIIIMTPRNPQKSKSPDRQAAQILPVLCRWPWGLWTPMETRSLEEVSHDVHEAEITQGTIWTLI